MEITPGGRALKFFAAVRIDVRNVEHVKRSDGIIGERLCLTVQKNKSAPPFKRAEIMILFGEGISHEDEILDLGVECGVFSKKGDWYIYNGLKIGQGRDNTKMYLSLNPDAKDEIVEEIVNLL
jgi:recombination protein RecA